jgi:hypothetical protein
MPNPNLTRRYLMFIAGAATIARPALAEVRAIHVVKDRNCGCCPAWIDVLAAEGFSVTTEDSLGILLMRYKADNGIPQDMISCHTGKVAGYMLEGHVPPADIRRPLAERPDAIGLAVPGMPYGSPGMGPENERDAYDVFLIQRDGTAEVFTRYQAS